MNNNIFWVFDFEDVDPASEGDARTFDAYVYKNNLKCGFIYCGW